MLSVAMSTLRPIKIPNLSFVRQFSNFHSVFFYYMGIVFAAGLCSQTFCNKGKMCVERKVGSIVSAECVCPASCTSENLPVCSVYHVQFPNLCELHRFACANEIHIQVKHQGNCTEQGKMPSEYMLCVKYLVPVNKFNFTIWLNSQATTENVPT